MVDIKRAIAREQHAFNLREAERLAASIIRVPRIKRLRSKEELKIQQQTRSANAFFCFHERSYTQPCVACKRSVKDAERELIRIRSLLSMR